MPNRTITLQNWESLLWNEWMKKSAYREYSMITTVVALLPVFICIRSVNILTYNRDTWHSNHKWTISGPFPYIYGIGTWSLLCLQMPHQQFIFFQSVWLLAFFNNSSNHFCDLFWNWSTIFCEISPLFRCEEQTYEFVIASRIFTSTTAK